MQLDGICKCLFRLGQKVGLGDVVVGVPFQMGTIPLIYSGRSSGTEIVSDAR